MSDAIEASWFVRGMVKATADMWLKGWDEGNGGNGSLGLLPEDLAPYRQYAQGNRELGIGETIPELAGQTFLATGSGKYFRNVQLNPADNLGIIEISPDGASVRVLWGYNGGGAPTSELSAHLKSHRERQRISQGASRVIMHCHATNLLALSYVLQPSPQVFTRAL